MNKKFKPAWKVLIVLFFVSVALFSGISLISYSNYIEIPEKEWQRYRDIVILTAGIVTLILTYWRSSILSEQIKLQTQTTETQTKQISIQDRSRLDEQFKQAVEFLAKEEHSAQTGAVFMLAALAKHSPEHTQRCLDMLCSLNEWMAERLEKIPNYFSRKEKNEKGKEINKKILWRDKVFKLDQTSLDDYWKKYLQTGNPDSAPDDKAREEAKNYIAQERLSQTVIKETEKIITEVIRKKLDDQAFAKLYPQGLSLAQRFLPQINLYFSHLKKRFVFHSAHLEGANLWSAHLEGAKLRSAHLEGANLESAHLEGANLESAHLEGAYLWSAHLEGAKFYDIKIDAKTNFKNSTGTPKEMSEEVKKRLKR